MVDCGAGMAAINLAAFVWVALHYKYKDVQHQRSRVPRAPRAPRPRAPTPRTEAIVSAPSRRQVWNPQSPKESAHKEQSPGEERLLRMNCKIDHLPLPIAKAITELFTKLRYQFRCQIEIRCNSLLGTLITALHILTTDLGGIMVMSKEI